MRFALSCPRWLLICALLCGCASLTRTNLMLKDWVGKPIDAFIKERVYAPDNVVKMNDGSAVYEFHGGPGGQRCRFYLVTDASGIITKYRFEDC